MKKIFAILLMFIFIQNVVLSAHLYKENEYQKVWCKRHNGILEYKNYDSTRVDCLTDVYAVEFDFANKWAESAGQALYYGILTCKKPKVVLILENPQKDICHYHKLKKLADVYKFEIEIVTPDIFK